MSAVVYLLIVAAVAVLAWLAGTRRRPAPRLDHPDRVWDEHVRTAMAALTPDALDTAAPDHGVAAGATAYLRDLASPPQIPITPDPRNRPEDR